MSSRSLVTLVLVVLVASAAALLWYGGGDRPSRRETVAAPDDTAVTRIRVQRRDRPDLAFEKDGGGWQLTEPIRIAANPTRVAALLALPRTTSHARIDADRAGPETLGLMPPQATLVLGGRQFDFGGTDPIDDYRYVRHGDSVHLIDDRLFPQLNQPAAFFVAARLLPEQAVIERVEYPDHVILRLGGHWEIRPAGTAANTPPAERIGEWRRARARQVLPYRPGRPDGEVRVRTGDGSIVFEIVPAERGLLLARPGPGLRYRLTPDTATRLGLAEYLQKESP